MSILIRSRKRFQPATWALVAALAGFGVVAHAALSPTAAHAQEADDGDAFDRLDAYGDWVNHWRYGRVWYPRDVDDEWRPYTRGRWELTDDYGWYWDSREPWGWATYHYGRWALDDDYGWIWIPGDTWAPAWVDWRQSDDQIGWAPLPPEVAWGGDGLAFGEVDLVSEHYRPAWCFVPLAHFHDRDMRRYIAPPSRNVTIINSTTRITNYTTINNTIVNRSVDPRRIGAAMHREIVPVRVNLTPQPPRTFSQVGQRDKLQGLRVFRPDVHLSARPLSPQVPALPQGGFKAPVRGPEPLRAPEPPRGPEAGPRPGPVRPQFEAVPQAVPQAPVRRDDDRVRALERRQAEEAQRLQILHAREQANSDAARNAEIVRRHQAEQSEMRRIQQQQRAAVQNRLQMPAPPQRVPQAQPQPFRPQPPPPQARPQPPVPPGQQPQQPH